MHIIVKLLTYIGLVCEMGPDYYSYRSLVTAYELFNQLSVFLDTPHIVL